MANEDSADSPHERRSDRTPTRSKEVRERRAVEAATAEDLGDGVRRDIHGETVPDPYPDVGDDDAATSDEMIERHRRDAEAIEKHDD